MPISGTYSEHDGNPIVRFERTFPHPPEAVWRAVTEPERLEQWFPTTVEFDELRVGEPIRFAFTHGDYPTLSGEIREVSPPRRLVFTWGDDLLTFELAPAEEGAACRLAFSVALDSAEKAARDAAGWEGCLDGLAELVAARSPQRPPDPELWRAYYAEYERAGLPARAPIPNAL
ncbi:MAG: SRPBCC family protein [Solirubrobacteraceae bacterium]